LLIATFNFIPATRCRRRHGAPHQHGGRFDSSSQANSTIIIRDNASAEDGKRSNVHVVVDTARCCAYAAQSEDNKNVIESQDTESDKRQTGRELGVNTEGTKKIRVNSGTVESANRAGERLSHQGGEYVSSISRERSPNPKSFDVPQPLQPTTWKKSSGCNGSASVAWVQKPQSGVPSYYRVRGGNVAFLCFRGQSD